MKKIFHKSRIYPLVLIVVVFLVWKYRESNKPNLVALKGTTMGPIQYTVQYLSSDGVNYQPEIDSLLESFNQSLNHYKPNSEISQFNRDSVFVFSSPYFHEVLEKSKEIYSATNGAFDPTIGPLVNAWGFGPGERQHPDSTMIDSLLKIVHFENLEFNDKQVWKKVKNLKLDFSAIAKGQGVDLVFDFLYDQGLQNIFVEIGGEVRCLGNNEKGTPWRIGIIDPIRATTAGEYYGSLALENKAMATSGNYFNFIDDGGQRIVHTINPKTGYPVSSNLLSASVISDNCMTADAFATALMVKGVDESISLSNKIDGLDIILIYSQADGSLKHYISEGLVNKFTRFQNIDNGN